MANTEDKHNSGALVTYNNELTIIAGKDTTKVEVFENGSEKWTSYKIDSAPDIGFGDKLEKVSALVVTESGTDSLFIFGKLIFSYYKIY